MSHPQPPQRQPTTNEIDQYTRTLHNVALFALVACPALALLPPRKLDFYTYGLGAGTLYSANYLVRERTGRSIYQLLGGGSPIDQPQAAHISPTEQANLSKERHHAKQEMQRLHVEESKPVTKELKARETWKAQREKEIQDDLDVGKGFGEMITDQIWEVWNWGRKSDDEDEG